jgi:hypothetical protein
MTEIRKVACLTEIAVRPASSPRRLRRPRRRWLRRRRQPEPMPEARRTPPRLLGGGPPAGKAIMPAVCAAIWHTAFSANKASGVRLAPNCGTALTPPIPAPRPGTGACRAVGCPRKVGTAGSNCWRPFAPNGCGFVALRGPARRPACPRASGSGSANG